MHVDILRYSDSVSQPPLPKYRAIGTCTKIQTKKNKKTTHLHIVARAVPRSPVPPVGTARWQQLIDLDTSSCLHLRARCNPAVCFFCGVWRLFFTPSLLFLNLLPKQAAILSFFKKAGCRRSRGLAAAALCLRERLSARSQRASDCQRHHQVAQSFSRMLMEQIFFCSGTCRVALCALCAARCTLRQALACDMAHYFFFFWRSQWRAAASSRAWLYFLCTPVHRFSLTSLFFEADLFIRLLGQGRKKKKDSVESAGATTRALTIFPSCRFSSFFVRSADLDDSCASGAAGGRCGAELSVDVHGGDVVGLSCRPVIATAVQRGTLC